MPLSHPVRRFFTRFRPPAFPSGEQLGRLGWRGKCWLLFLSCGLAVSATYLLRPLTKARAFVSTTVVISEFRVRGPNGASDEFVEIYNLGTTTVNIAGWKLKGSNNAGATSTRATVATGTMLGPGCHFLFTNNASSGYSGSVPGNQTYGTGITDDGGLAITMSDDTIVDQVGMSTGSAFKEGTVLASLGTTNTNQGYERKHGGAAGSGTDTDNNATDFQVLAPSDPQNLASGCIAPTLILTCMPTTIAETAGANASTCTVTRTGSTAAALVVNLMSNNTSEATVPLTATIPLNSAIKTFMVDAVDDLVADGTQTVTITASAATFTSGTATLMVTDNETPTLTLSCLPATFAENVGANASTCTVTRTGSTAAALTVDLLSNDTSEATIPLTTTIPLGSASTTFMVNAEDELLVDGTQTVLLTAAATTFTSGTATLLVTDNETLKIGLSDPLICTGDANTLSVHAEVTNPNNAAGTFTFLATLPPQLSGVANTCVITSGTCTVNAGEVLASGPLAANQTITIDYKVRVAPNTGPGANLCIDSMATLNGVLMATVQACKMLSCPAANVPVNAQASGQKAGSVLVFPYYISKAAEKKDTRLSITNTGAAQTYAHIFFIDGTTCAQSDLFLCLTPNAAFSFKASEYDPEATGWLLAVTVDANGLPVPNNALIGNAFVQDGQYVDNYHAQSFVAYSPALAAINGNTATLFFDGGSYDGVPGQFTAEIQSPVDASGQKIITAGLRGDLTTQQMTGAGQVGSGLATNGNEKPAGSFSAFLAGSCQAIAVISLASPRVPNGLGTMIPSGQAGSLKFNVGAAAGLLLTPRTAAWRGIRALHTTALTTTTITIPVLRPVC